MASVGFTRSALRLRWRTGVACRREDFGGIVYDHGCERLMLVRGFDVVAVADRLRGDRPAAEELEGIVAPETIERVLEELMRWGAIEAIDAAA